MALQTGLEGKPWYYGAVIGLLLAVAAYFGAYQVFFKSMHADLERQEGELAKLQARIQEGRAASRQLPQFREEVRRLELDLERLLRILPARRNTPELLRRIRDLAQQGDFNLLRFTPGGFVDQDFYSVWPISISLEGTYHNLALFFDRISRFSRIINIQDLDMRALSGSGPHTLRASFQAVTFVYKEDQEAEEETP